MPNPVYSGRLLPGGSGIYRPAWDTSGATMTIYGSGLHWGDNAAATEVYFAPGALPTADFAAQSDLTIDMAGDVWAAGSGGCKVTLRRKSTGAILAISSASTWYSSFSLGNYDPLTWVTVNEDPYQALTEGDLCVEASHGAGVTNTIELSDLYFSYTTPPAPPSAGGGSKRGPRVYPLKSQQWTPRRGPGSFY